MNKILVRPFITLIILAILATLLSASCGKKQDDPKETFYQFQTIISDKNFASCWDMLSSDTQHKIDTQLLKEARKEVNALSPEKRKESHPVLGVTGEEILKMEPKEFFILIMERTEAGSELVAKGASEIQSVTLKGTIATLIIRNQKDPIIMIKEGKTWKIEL